MFKLLCLCIITCAVAGLSVGAAESTPSTRHSDSSKSAETAGWSYHAGQEYPPASSTSGYPSSSGASYGGSSYPPPPPHMAQRHGFTGIGMGGGLSFLPILLIVGLGALILIPLLFLLFTPSGFGGGFGGTGFQGTSQFGKKRSINEIMQMKNRLIELASVVGSAIESQSKANEVKSE